MFKAIMSRVDRRVAWQCALLSACSIGLLGWFLVILRGPWGTGLIPVSVLTGLAGAVLTVHKAQFSKASTALIAFLIGILLALAEGMLILALGIVSLVLALAH